MDAWQTITSEIWLGDTDIIGNISLAGTSTTVGDLCYFNNVSVKEVSGFSSPSVDYPTDAYKLVESSGGTAHNTNVGIGGLTSGTAYSVSAFVKAGERSKVAIKDGAGANYAAAFDLSTGTLLWEGYAGISSITALANGWFKISVISSQASTTRYPMIVLLSDSYTTSSNFDYTGDGTSGVYIFGANLSQTTYAPPYAYTNGATATVTDTNEQVALPTGVTTVTLTDYLGVETVDSSPADPYIIPVGKWSKIIMT